MSGPKVDVLQILSACAHGAAFGAHYATARDIDAAREAVAELIEAATDLQDAMDEHDASPFDIGPSKRFIKADARHRAALAAIGETK